MSTDDAPTARGLEPTPEQPRGPVSQSVSRSVGRRQRRRQQQRKLAAAAAIAALAGGGVLAVGSHLNTTLHTPPPAPAAAPGGVLTIGAGTAPLTVDITATYNCSHCPDVLGNILGPLERARLSGTARVRYHLTPLPAAAHATNTSADASAGTDPASLAVANAIACASDMSAERAAAYWASLIPYPDGSTTEDSLVSSAAAVGVTGHAFTACVHNGTYKPWLTALSTEPANTGGTVEPTFSVNGAATAADAVLAALTKDTPPA